MVSRRAQLKPSIWSERNKTVAGDGAEERIRPAPGGWRSTLAGHSIPLVPPVTIEGHFYSAQ